jgi:transcriptional regulator with XRE-family HTH domain
LTISRWENGHREPRASDIQKLCEVLGVSESELLNGPGSNETKIIFHAEVMDMDLLKLEPAAYNFGFRDKDILIWGAISDDEDDDTLKTLIVDGKWGPKTQEAVWALARQAPQEFGRLLLIKRKEYFDAIIARDQSQEVFRKGWYARVAALAREAGVPNPV